MRWLCTCQASTMANRSRRRRCKSLIPKTICVCLREEVGAGFERREGKKESNWATFGRCGFTAWRTQIGAEPRVVSRIPTNRDRGGQDT